MSGSWKGVPVTKRKARQYAKHMGRVLLAHNLMVPLFTQADV